MTQARLNGLAISLALLLVCAYATVALSQALGLWPASRTRTRYVTVVCERDGARPIVCISEPLRIR